MINYHETFDLFFFIKNKFDILLCIINEKKNDNQLK